MLNVAVQMDGMNCHFKTKAHRVEVEGERGEGRK